MNQNLIRRIFHALLGFIYLGMGIYIFVKKLIPISPWNEILAVVFVLYGAFRIYRAFNPRMITNTTDEVNRPSEIS